MSQGIKVTTLAVATFEHKSERFAGLTCPKGHDIGKARFNGACHNPNGRIECPDCASERGKRRVQKRARLELIKQRAQAR
jgi:hypothetical protein